MNRKFVFLICILVMTFMSCTQKKSDVIFHESHEQLKKEAPFSDAVETEDFLFLSGQVGMNHTTRTLVTGGIEKETEQCIANIKAVLDHHGLSLDNVVKCTVILKDINDFIAFNTIYKEYFTNKPARTTFAASGLAVDASIEIDVIAAK